MKGFYGAVDPYHPFLIPLLSGSPHAHNAVSAGQVPRSTLEEENALCGFTGQTDEIWEYLEEMVEAKYGLPLLLDLVASSPARSLAKGTASASPERFLEVESGGRCWFLIEHPTGIPLIDRYARDGQTAAIARPSVFARLWREKETEDYMNVSESGSVEEAVHETGRAIETFLSEMILGDRPSDWHLEPAQDYYRSRIRVDGCLQEEIIMKSGRGKWLVNSVISRAGIQEKPGMPAEGRLAHPLPSGERITLRISLVPAQYGLAMVVRFLYPVESGLPQLESLGLSERTCSVFSRRYTAGKGLWIAAGPTGSGKSTTLRALIQLSIGRSEKVLSIEDPVEYPLEGAHHLSIDSPPGLTWAGAIRAFLRQAPDTILIGEIRDEETAAISLQAARTGHRVLTSLHARDNPGVRRRFLDLGQDERSLESVFECVLHQRLLPRLCPHCRRLMAVPEPIAGFLRDCDLPVPDSAAEPAGCPNCHAGRKGRLAIFTSGDFSSRLPVEVELRQAAWNAFINHQVSFIEIIPFLPAEVRARLGFANRKVSVKTI